MQVYDKIKNFTYDEEKYRLIDLVQYHNRQVNLYFDEVKTDEHGFIHWDMETWCCVDGRRFIRTYGIEGRIRKEFSGYNVYDLESYFLPETASKVELA